MHGGILCGLQRDSWHRALSCLSFPQGGNGVCTLPVPSLEASTEPQVSSCPARGRSKLELTRACWGFVGLAARTALRGVVLLHTEAPGDPAQPLAHWELGTQPGSPEVELAAGLAHVTSPRWCPWRAMSLEAELWAEKGGVWGEWSLMQGSPSSFRGGAWSWCPGVVD